MLFGPNPGTCGSPNRCLGFWGRPTSEDVVSVLADHPDRKEATALEVDFKAVILAVLLHPAENRYVKFRCLCLCVFLSLSEALTIEEFVSALYHVVKSLCHFFISFL
jgi:hypothetical protein